MIPNNSGKMINMASIAGFEGRADHTHPSARDQVGQAQHQRDLSGLFPDEAVGRVGGKGR